MSNDWIEVDHCKDCCCAQSWKALGITSYTGKSIPEHIRELAEQRKELLEALKEWVLPQITRMALMHTADTDLEFVRMVITKAIARAERR